MPSVDLGPAGIIPAEYGYWIDGGGTVLHVDQQGHIPFLMDLDEFIDLSPTQPYRDWYDAALSRGWIRVIAPAGERQRFSFQFKALNPATRHSLISLLTGLPLYASYVFESSEYQMFRSPEDAVRFVEQYDGAASEFGTETWSRQ